MANRDRRDSPIWPECHPADLSRRRLLQAGSVMWGLSLSQSLRLQTLAAAAQPQVPGSGQAKSCIVLFCWGGMSHLESFDPKPEAPAETRGEFQTIATATPGLRMSEHLPNTARRSEHLAIVRSVHHLNTGHGKGMYWNLTGHPPPEPASPANLPPSRNDWPSLGAMVSQFRQAPPGFPAAIQLPYEVTNEHSLLAGQLGGWLGRQADPMIARPPCGTPFRGNKYDAGSVPPWEFPTQSDERGIQNRHRLLQQLERPFDRSIAAESYNFYRQQAFDLLVSPEVRRAFDLRHEPESIHHAYGDHLCGQSVLMARRLIEAGVPIVTVMCAFANLSAPRAEHWDTHSNNFNRLKHTMLPLFDRVFPALLDDLESRGQLDETLVVVIGDFGRTPKINGEVGRDHHPYCYSVVFAGGGIRGGQVYGASDAIGAYPARLPCAPHDLHATVFHALGIPLLSELQDQFDRPRYLCDAGQPLPLF